jgi:superfamily II DNA or RNA helicase
MKFFQSNLEYIETENRYEASQLERNLTYRVKGYQGKEEVLVLFNKLEKDLYEAPRFTHTMLETKRKRLEVERDDFVSIKVKYPKFLLDLRKEQKKAIDAYLDECKYETGSILVLPPASGKTILGARIASILKERTVIIVHRTNFFKVWKDDISKAFGIDPKEIGEIRGKTNTIGKRFTLATFQTLATKIEKDPKLFEKFGFAIFDEAHHVPANLFSLVASKFKSKYMLGITGTFERADGLQTMSNLFLGRISYYNTDIDHNHVETANIFRIDTNVPLYVRKGEHIHKMYHALMSNRDRFFLFLEIFELNKKQKRRQLVFTHSTTYAKLYNALLNELGFKSGLMIGGDTERNLKTKQAMLDGKLDVIVATVAFMQEGESINNIETIHFLTPLSNKVQYYQAVARGQRQYPDKQKLIVFDYVDNLIPRCMRYWESRKEWSRQNNGHKYSNNPFSTKVFKTLK